jgi:hypothetical protein
MKLAVLLGLRDKTEKTFGLMLDDMFSKFKNKQGLFKGFQKTYQAVDGYADEPSKRGYEAVASTVKEQLDWFKQHVTDYFNITFSIEKTNATGVITDFIVNGENWGKYSTLELLRLKSVLDGKIKGLISELPIRKESVIWKKSTNADHEGREIFESPVDEGFSKTTIKESYILVDPHPDQKRQPIVGEKSTQVNIGAYTSQDYSGEYTTRQRALILAKYDQLYKAVIAALENANTIESQESDLGDKVLEFLF